jgi:hypothetical protein
MHAKEPTKFLTLNGDPNHWVRIPKSQHIALSCRGSNDYFTISAFVRPTGIKENLTILHLDRVSNLQLWFFLTKNETQENYSLNFGVDYYGIGWNWFEVKNSVKLYRWSHVCVVKNDETISLYVNGECKCISVQTNDCPLSKQDWYIGQNRAEPHTYFTGDIAHVALWRKALSDTEITEIASMRSMPTKELRFWYPLNEGSGVVTKDWSSFDVNGFVVGAKLVSDVFFTVSQAYHDISIKTLGDIL